MILLLLACADPGALPVAPPPPALQLTVDPVTIGAPATVRATGARPGETVWFGASTAGFGAYCPPSLGGACLGILPRITTLGSAVADAAGAVRLTFRPPAGSANARFGVQAAVPGAPGRVSNPVSVWFAPAGSDPAADADHDGWTRLAGDCDDADPARAPGLPDPVGDRVDADCDGADGTDADRDGVASIASGGLDCDDADPDVTPGAVERCDLRDDDCDGLVDEGMPDVDGSGTPDCHEVAVVATWGFVSHDLTFWLCDDTLPTTRELQALDAVITATGLTMVRVDEDPVDGVDAAQIAPYAAVIVHNGGWADPLRPGTVDALLALPGAPVVWLGDDVGLLADRTASTYGRREVFDLTHIGGFLHNGNEAFKGLGAVMVDPDHPLAAGPFGGAGSFSYGADMDHVALAGQGERVVMVKEQVETPAVWAFEDAGRRVAVIQPSVYDNNVCPVSDEAGRASIAHLVQNALAWGVGLR